MNTDDIIRMASEGDAPSQYNLGVMYAEGIGIQQDKVEAIKWWTKAAEQGHSQAQYNLGHLYAEGEIGEPNVELAVKWLTMAAENGLAEGQFALALLFHSGRIVEKNLELAIRWYQKAAEQGFTQALFNLGHIYTEGGEYNPDPIKAYILFKLALALGDINSKARIKQLTESLSQDQIMQANATVSSILNNARQ